MDARIRTCIHVQTQINVHTCIQTSMNTTTNTTRHLYKHTTCIFMRRRAHTHCGGNGSKVVSPERERAMSELRNEPTTSDHCLGDHQPPSPVQCTPEAVGNVVQPNNLQLSFYMFCFCPIPLPFPSKHGAQFSCRSNGP